jgi:glycosyltransferase 2 family protein
MDDTTTKKAKGKNVKLIVQIIFFAALIVLATIYILKDDPKTTFQTLSEAHLLPLCYAVLLLLASLFLDGMNITLLARLYNPHYKYHQGVINVAVGQTLGVFVKTAACLPQAITFTKQDIKSAQGASVLTMNYLLYQFSLFLYSLIMVLFGYPVVKDIPIDLLGGLSLFSLCIIALSVQLLILFAILSLGFARKLHRLVLNNGINLVARMHILRNPEMTRRKLTLQFATYRIEMKRLFQHKILVCIIILSNLLKLFCLGSIPFMVFLSLNANMESLSFFNSLFITGYVNTISSLVSVGVPEVMFQSAFSYYLSNCSNALGLASAANLLWRSVTFYLLFFIGLITMLTYKGAPKRHQILGSTQTIYDMELSNLLDTDEATKSYLEEIHLHGNEKHAPLLSKGQVAASFRGLRKSLMEEDDNCDKEDAVEESLSIELERQRLALAQIEKEVTNLINQDKPDFEIQKEADQDIHFQEEASQKKNALRERRKKRKELKYQKKLLKLQPKGTTIKEGEDGSLIYIFEKEITECVSLPTSQEDEDEKVRTRDSGSRR